MDNNIIHKYKHELISNKRFSTMTRGRLPRIRTYESITGQNFTDIYIYKKSSDPILYDPIAYKIFVEKLLTYFARYNINNYREFLNLFSDEDFTFVVEY